MIAKTPKPPYYAVIFTSVKSENNEGYSEMASMMMKLAYEQDGFLGVETAQEDIGITVSYWRNLESIKKWKENKQHSIARSKGKSLWYNTFTTRISLVEKEYSFNND